MSCIKQSSGRIGQIRPGGSCFSSRVTRSKRSMFRRPNLHEAGDSGRRKPARALRAQGTHQNQHRQRQTRHTRGTRATSQANGDMAATVVGRAQGGRKAARRPGGLGRSFATTFTRRDRRCLQDIQEHSRFGTRLHQPQLLVELRVRFIDLLMASGANLVKPSVLGTHDGFEAQEIRRSSHNRPHGRSIACSFFPPTQENEHDTAWARRVIARLGHIRCWWRQ